MSIFLQSARNRYRHLLLLRPEFEIGRLRKQSVFGKDCANSFDKFAAKRIFQRDHRNLSLTYFVRILDRYVLRNFLQVYLYCIAGFISIWLIFDISDNISTFIDERVGLLLTVRYYLTQVPQVFIILLPVSLLLALLFSLGRMSRANEIVSMLTAGVSLPRVLLPLIGMGLLTVAATMALNYSLAPHAEMARKTFLSEAQARPARYVEGQIFRNRTDSRTWFVQSFLP